MKKPDCKVIFRDSIRWFNSRQRGNHRQSSIRILYSGGETVERNRGKRPRKRGSGETEERDIEGETERKRQRGGIKRQR